MNLGWWRVPSRRDLYVIGILATDPSTIRSSYTHRVRSTFRSTHRTRWPLMKNSISATVYQKAMRPPTAPRSMIAPTGIIATFGCCERGARRILGAIPAPPTTAMKQSTDCSRGINALKVRCLSIVIVTVRLTVAGRYRTSESGRSPRRRRQVQPMSGATSLVLRSLLRVVIIAIRSCDGLCHEAVLVG